MQNYSKNREVTPEKSFTKFDPPFFTIRSLPQYPALWIGHTSTAEVGVSGSEVQKVRAKPFRRKASLSKTLVNRQSQIENGLRHSSPFNPITSSGDWGLGVGIRVIEVRLPPGQQTSMACGTWGVARISTALLND